MVPLGLNSFTAFRATMDAANDSAIANYVKELEDSNLGKSSADAQSRPALASVDNWVGTDTSGWC